jgi:hypothetical protein
MCIINPFLLRAGGDETQDRARPSAGVLPLPIKASPSPSDTKIRPRSVSHPDFPRIGRADLPAHAVARPASILTP